MDCLNTWEKLVMADCYYHGYSGGPGRCSMCDEEERRGLDPGTLPGHESIPLEHLTAKTEMEITGRKESLEEWRKRRRKK